MEDQDLVALLTSFGIRIVILLVMEVNYQFIATVARTAHFIHVLMAIFASIEMRTEVFSLWTYFYMIFYKFDDSIKKKL